MKKIFTQFVIFVLLGSLSVNAETLQAGVSVNEIPKDFFGSWQIVGSLEKTNSPKTFKGKSSDYWNHFRSDRNVSVLVGSPAIKNAIRPLLSSQPG